MGREGGCVEGELQSPFGCCVERKSPPLLTGCPSAFQPVSFSLFQFRFILKFK